MFVSPLILSVKQKHLREMLIWKTNCRWTTCSSRRRLTRTPRTECSEWGRPAGRAQPSPTSARRTARSSATGGRGPWAASSRPRRSSSRPCPSPSPTTTSWWRNCKYWPRLPVLDLSVSALPAGKTTNTSPTNPGNQPSSYRGDGLDLLTPTIVKEE